MPVLKNSIELRTLEKVKPVYKLIVQKTALPDHPFPSTARVGASDERIATTWCPAGYQYGGNYLYILDSRPFQFS